jgi:hypothetical protein
MFGRVTLPVLFLALLVTSPVGAQSPSAIPEAGPSAAPTAAPSPTATAIASSDSDQAAACQSLEIRPERCYLQGGASIRLRGAIRRTVTWPLLKGVGATSDYIPSIGLHFGPPDEARLVIDLPGVPGESSTPRDGDSAGPGEAQVWWSLPGSVAGYGHACAVAYEADAVGRLTGSLRCPTERKGDGERFRVEVAFDVQPVLAGPLPTPQPTPVPSPPTLADMVCDLLDSAEIEDALRLKDRSVLLLDAGPGQCAGIADDREVAFVSILEAAAEANLVGAGEYRGAACEALPLVDLGDAASAASCTWPDQRSFVVGSILQGTTLLVVSLASDDLTTDELLAGVSALVAMALDRID